MTNKQVKTFGSDRLMFNVAGLAEHWGVSDTMVYTMLNTGQLEGFKLGGKLWRIRMDAVEAYENRPPETKVAGPDVSTPKPLSTVEGRKLIARLRRDNRATGGGR